MVSFLDCQMFFFFFFSLSIFFAVFKDVSRHDGQAAMAFFFYIYKSVCVGFLSERVEDHKRTSLTLSVIWEAPLSAVYSGISCVLDCFHENSYCANAFSPKGGFQACLEC